MLLLLLVLATSVAADATADASATNDSQQSNFTGNSTGEEEEDFSGRSNMDFWTILFGFCYCLICVVGLVGNGLVILVVLRYAKMKTVTNMYILNLAVADMCFIFGLPFLIATLVMRYWVFGFYMCKLFYIQTSINWFTSVFILTVMSADRYLAVCHPVTSMRFRTPMVSRILCICVWCFSLLVMLPIVLYATTYDYHGEGRPSCTILWPEGQPISGQKAFIWYTLLLGFAIPVALICVFYTLVVLRLRTVGPKNKKKKSHRKVTKMVLVVIAVYVICWAPYWIYQMINTYGTSDPSKWSIRLFQVITIMSYSNSMLNPVLYAFLSENFRKCFIKAFKCASAAEVNGALHAEHSVFPGRKGTTTVTTTGATTVTTRTTNTTGPTDEDEEADEEMEFMPTNHRESDDLNNQNDPTKVILANHDVIKMEANGDSQPTEV